MVFSPLTNRSVHTTKYSSRNGAAVSRLIVHYTAGGTTASNVALLSTGSRQVSATYVLGRDGELVGIVPEERRPWTTGGPAADNPSVTIEVVATQASGVTTAQMNKLSHLAADLCKRYRWSTLNRRRIMGHREFIATECPGPLWPRLQEIADRGNTLLGTPPATPPVLGPGSTGAAVSALQRGLNRVFPAYSKLVVDGHYGPSTTAVVREFQRRTGLTADGIVGPQTRAALGRHGITF